MELGKLDGHGWRRGRDLNSRMGYPISGFQDRHVRPLRHPSIPCFPHREPILLLLATGQMPSSFYSFRIRSSPPI